MSKNILSKELISLIHHIELNKVGWWDKTVQSLITAIIWLSNKSLTKEDIEKRLHEDFPTPIDSQKLVYHIDKLCSAGTLIHLTNNEYKISEEALKKFTRKLKEAEELENKVKYKFGEILKDLCPSLQAENTWKKVNEQLIIPLIRDMGARTYELFTGPNLDLNETKMFLDFLKSFPVEIRQQMRTAVISYLNPKDTDIRTYILHYLNTCFFVEAGNLSAETVNMLSNLAGLNPSFTVFVDTNFIFSILGMQENPSNEAVFSLTNLVDQLKNKINIKLCMLSITIDEAKRALIGAEQNVSELRLTSNLASATLETGLALRGFSKRFVEKSKNTSRALTARDFFGPYINNLTSVIADKGIGFFNEKIEKYKTKQEVMDDINQQLEFEYEHSGKRAKGYEQLEHDIVLWHFTKDKRPETVESPFNAGYWIVTLDYRFLGFDSFKRREQHESIPVCIHPTTLIQMLQFWIPRTPQFEEAMLGSMRLPFLFQEFDPEAEQVTIRILETLGRFENIGDFSKETITSILLNDALRNKLSSEPDITKRIDLVRETLIEDYNKLKQRLNKSEEVNSSLRGQVDNKDKTIQLLKNDKEQEQEKRLNAEKELKEEQKARQFLEKNFNEKIKTIDDEKKKTKEIRNFIIKWITLPVFTSGILSIIISLLTKIFIGLPFWFTFMGIWSILLMLWIWLADRTGIKNSIVQNWSFFKQFHKFKKLLFAFLGLVLISSIATIIGNAVWEFLKKIFKI